MPFRAEKCFEVVMSRSPISHRRDIVCLISGEEDKLLEYKQKTRFTGIASLQDVHDQLTNFLMALGVREQVHVELLDDDTNTWRTLDSIESMPDKARLRIRKFIYTMNTHTGRREKASRQKGDIRMINGRKRIWSGTRWNCEHDRRLSECKLCAAKHSNQNSGGDAVLHRHKSDNCFDYRGDGAEHQKRRRVEECDTHRHRQWNRQASLPSPVQLEPVSRRPLEPHQGALNDVNHQPYAFSPKFSPAAAAAARAGPAKPSQKAGKWDDLGKATVATPSMEEQADDLFWELFNELE